MKKVKFNGGTRTRYLTVGHEYPVVFETAHQYKVIDNDGVHAFYDKVYFSEVAKKENGGQMDKKGYTLEAVVEYVKANQDKRYIIITMEGEEKEPYGLIMSPKGWLKELGDVKGCHGRVLGLEFTNGITDCVGGHWSREEEDGKV